MKPYIEDDDGNEITIPMKREVCGRCRGSGSHDPAAFSNGFTQEDFDEDPDFREEYMAGRYDVTCEECHGNNVVDVPDRDRMSPDLIARLDRWYRDQAANRAEEEAERRMGA